MPNIEGPKQPWRFHLSSVVYSVILYGDPTWADAISNSPCYGAGSRRACRTIALRLTCAYRIVSDIALSIITGLPPLDLMAAERAEIHHEGMVVEVGDYQSPGKTIR